jgi:hypothetical protein
MEAVTLLQAGTMNDELRIRNTSAGVFIRHSSFVIFNPSKVPAPLFSYEMPRTQRFTKVNYGAFSIRSKAMRFNMSCRGG